MDGNGKHDLEAAVTANIYNFMQNIIQRIAKAFTLDKGLCDCCYKYY